MPFVRKHPETPDNQNAVKRWQLEQGRTSKRLTELQQQLCEAEGTLAKAEAECGERRTDGVAVDMDAVILAKQNAAQLQYAFDAATRKDQIAKQSLADAQREVASEAAGASVVHLRHATEKIEHWRRTGRSLIDTEFKPALLRVRAVTTGEQNWVTVLELQFKKHLHEACSALIPEGQADTWRLRDSSLVDFVPTFEDLQPRKRG